MDHSILGHLAALVALQFGLHALSWALGAGMLREQRAQLAHWSAFLACIGLGFALMTLRGDDRSWIAFNGAVLCWAGGLLMLWRGVELQFGVSGRGRQQLALFALLVGLNLWIGPSRETAVPRVASTYGGLAVIMVGLLLSVRGTVWRRLGPARALGLMLPGFIVLGVFVWLAVRQLLDPSKALELHRFDSATVRSMYAYLVAAALFNFTFMALVVNQLLGQLRRQGERDALTGLYNRGALRNRLAEQWARWQRDRQAFAVVALDLDHFKRVNDSHGHPIGDALLEHVARQLREHVRGHDVVARMGGEEFMVLLPQSGLTQAHVLAARLRDALRTSTLVAGGAALRVTGSFGVAEVGLGDVDVDAVLRRADRALYRAKAEGRDQVQEADAA